MSKPPLCGSAPEPGSALRDLETGVEEQDQIEGLGHQVLAQRSLSTTAWVRRRDYHTLREAQMRQSQERDSQKAPAEQQGSMKRTRSVGDCDAGCKSSKRTDACIELLSLLPIAAQCYLEPRSCTRLHWGKARGLLSLASAAGSHPAVQVPGMSADDEVSLPRIRVGICAMDKKVSFNHPHC